MLLRAFALQRIISNPSIRTIRTTTILGNKAQSSLVPSVAIKPKTEIPLRSNQPKKRAARPNPPKSFSTYFLAYTGNLIVLGITGAVGTGAIIAMGSLAVFAIGASLELGTMMLERVFFPKKNSEKAALEPPKRNSLPTKEEGIVSAPTPVTVSNKPVST